MPDFDTAANFQRAVATGAGVPTDNFSNICHLKSRNITVPQSTSQMMTVLVGAADEVGHGGGAVIYDDAHRHAYRAKRTKACAQPGLDFVCIGQCQWRRKSG